MTKSPDCVFLFDMTRHRSHLFFRYLSTHPTIQSLWHPYLPAFLFGPERITQHTHKADATEKKADVQWEASLSPDTYAIAEQKFMQAYEEAKDQNKILVANEHCQMITKQAIDLAIIRKLHDIPSHANPTVIPDSVFEKLRPIFIIRNPVFAVPSNYKGFSQTSTIRPGDEDWDLITGMQIQRYLFDFFRDRDGRAPLVIDGDDVVWKTAEVGSKACEALKIDRTGLHDEWEAVPEEQRSSDPLLRHFLQDINDSTGIVRSTDAPPDAGLEFAYSAWRASFGEQVAAMLKAKVEENMPHYEYMKTFAL